MLVLVVLAGCESPAATIHSARSDLALASEATADIDEARTAAMIAFLDAADAAEPGTQPCPLAVETPAGLDDWRFSLLDRRDLPDQIGPRRAAFVVEYRALMAQFLLLETVDRANADRLSAEVVAASTPWPWDITLVTEEMLRPRYDETTGYVPGTIRGRLFVWDYQADRLACTAPVNVTNSPAVLDNARADADALAAFEEDPDGALFADLVTVALSEGMGALTAVE